MKRDKRRDEGIKGRWLNKDEEEKMKKRRNRDYEISAQTVQNEKNDAKAAATRQQRNDGQNGTRVDELLNRRTISYRITRKNFTTPNQRQTKPISTHHRVDLSPFVSLTARLVSPERSHAERWAMFSAPLVVCEHETLLESLKWVQDVNAIRTRYKCDVY